MFRSLVTNLAAFLSSAALCRQTGAQFRPQTSSAFFLPIFATAVFLAAPAFAGPGGAPSVGKSSPGASAILVEPWNFIEAIDIRAPKAARYASIAVDSDRFIFLSDEFSSGVHKFTHTGEFVKSGPTDRPGIARPARLVLKKDRVYLHDPQAGRIHLLSRTLETLAIFDLSDIIGPRAGSTSSFDISGDWKFYLAETLIPGVIRLDPEMRPDQGFGCGSSYVVSRGRPTSIAADPDGGVWVFEWTAGSITRYDGTGSMVRSSAPNPPPRIISMRFSRGFALGCDMRSKTVLVFDKSGNSAGFLGLPGPDGVRPFDGIPRDACGDDRGRLFVLVAGPGGHRVVSYGSPRAEDEASTLRATRDMPGAETAENPGYRVFLRPLTPPGAVDPLGSMTGPSMAMALGLDPPELTSRLSRGGIDLYIRGERVKNFDFEIDGDDAILFFDDPRAGSGAFPCQAKVVVNLEGIIRMGSVILGIGDEKSKSRAVVQPQEKR